MRIALIVNDNRWRVWQREALRQLDDHEVVLVLSCTNSVGGRRRRKHYLYYALNLVTIRNRETRAIRLTAGDLPSARWHEFQSSYRGAWQVLPDEVIRMVRSSRVEAVVKFGMGLLVVPEWEKLPVPILSFHHGNPEKYRGRPAGLYEILNGEDSIGVMVQQITNNLDAGHILAFAESAVFPHSYRKTLINHYRTGCHLLAVALRNLASGRTIDMKPTGKNYRLPTNAVVLRFALREWIRKLQRATYGAFIEKRWRVSLSTETTTDEFLAGEPIAGERILDVEKQFAFYADPFLVSKDTAVLEALSKCTGVGTLVLVGPSGSTVLTSGAKHYSYPCVIHQSDRTLVLPEIANWSSPQIFELDGTKLTAARAIDIEDAVRVVDATYYLRDNRHYIFGCKRSTGTAQLFLWHADQLHGPYVEHPSSPICVTPRGARMAGHILVLENRVLRLGQNNCGDYGNGVFIYEVLRLTGDEYEETLVGELRFTNRKGPHTINTLGGTLVWDWYDERINPVAGVRRLRGLIRNLANSKALSALPATRRKKDPTEVGQKLKMSHNIASRMVDKGGFRCFEPSDVTRDIT